MTLMSSQESLERRVAAIEEHLGIGSRICRDRGMARVVHAVLTQQHSIEEATSTPLQHVQRRDHINATIAGTGNKLEKMIALLGRLAGGPDTSASKRHHA